MTTSLGIDDVTFGITSFERPHLLVRLVHSILKNYPHAKIIVADNGRRKAKLPSQVRVLDLPFDCGLSATRNALAGAIDTKLMLLLEEDFYFLPTTRIENLIDVISSDPEVGVVGGAMLGPMGSVVSYSMDIEVFRETLSVRETKHRQQFTRSGTPYRICDLIWNFALFRKEMMLQHPWDDALKVGEHTPYYFEVKKAAQWRVACCTEAVIYHVPDRRSEFYREHRMRARDLFHGYLHRNGLKRYRRVKGPRVDEPLCDKPNVVILGVGHSGTSILSKMMHRGGWQAVDADQKFGESVTIRRLNMLAKQSGQLPQGALHILRKMPQPWAIKDPRFIWTLHLWLHPLAKMAERPTLVRIRRRSEAVVRSYRRRGVKGDLHAMVRQREELCTAQYHRWPWEKVTIEYDQLGAAAGLFDSQRMDRHDPVEQLGLDTSRSLGTPMQAMEMLSDWSEADSFHHDGSGYDDGSTVFYEAAAEGVEWDTEDGSRMGDGSGI